MTKNKGMLQILMVIFLSILICSGEALAEENHDRQGCGPTEAEIQSYKADGTWEERLDYYNTLKTDEVSPTLVQNAIAREKGMSAQNAVPSDWKEMTPTGKPRVLFIRIGFKDFPVEGGTFSRDKLTDIAFGKANPESNNYPYESLDAYYKRASYGKLALPGSTADIYDYTAKENRQYYGKLSNEALLIKEALENLDEQVDFSQYDVDGDDKLDGIYINFSGPNSGWGSTWWSHKFKVDAGLTTVDGKQPGGYVFLETDEGCGNRILIHETGHLLGLPDYYSYDTQKFADGIATFDMMMDNSGDHNGFSKWLLGWLSEDQIIHIDQKSVTENPVSLSPLSSENGAKVAVLAPESKGIQSEFFLMQYDKAINNQSDVLKSNRYDNEGFRLFHVNGTLNPEGTNFQYQNVTTKQQKLIELVYPPDAISLNTMHTFFKEGDLLTPDTVPSSHFWGGSRGFTGIKLTDFITGETPSFKIAFDEKPIDSGELTLNPDHFSKLTDLSNSFEIKLIANRAVKSNEKTRVEQPFLECGDTKIPVVVTFKGLYDVEIRYHDMTFEKPLKSETKYTLVIPKEYFELGENIYSKEIRLPVETGKILAMEKVTNGASNTWSATNFGSFSDGSCLRIEQTGSENDAIHLIARRIDKNDQETEIPLILEWPTGSAPGTISKISGVVCREDTFVLSLYDSKNGRTLLYKMDNKAKILADPVIIEENLRAFPSGDGVKAQVIPQDHAHGSPEKTEEDLFSKLYTINFQEKPTMAQLDFGMFRDQAYYPLDAQTFAHGVRNSPEKVTLNIMDNQNAVLQTIDLGEEYMLLGVLRQEQDLLVFTGKYRSYDTSTLRDKIDIQRMVYDANGRLKEQKIVLKDVIIGAENGMQIQAEDFGAHLMMKESSNQMTKHYFLDQKGTFLSGITFKDETDALYRKGRYAFRWRKDQQEMLGTTVRLVKSDDEDKIPSKEMVPENTVLEASQNGNVGTGLTGQKTCLVMGLVLALMIALTGLYRSTH